jgi:hypothetical protein
VFDIDTAEKTSFGNKRFEIIFDKIVTGIFAEQEDLQEKATIFPNPVSELLNIKTTHLKSASYNWIIYAINGQVIEAGTCNKELQTINTTNFTEGFYFIELQSENFKQVSKFVK